MRISFLTLIWFLFGCFFPGKTAAQEMNFFLTTEVNTFSLGDSVLVKWNAKQFERVYIVPFGKVDQRGERYYHPKTDCSLVLIGENDTTSKVEVKRLILQSGIKSTEPAKNNLYKYPIKGKVLNKTLLQFSDILEEVLQMDLQFSLYAAVFSTPKRLAVKTNLASRYDLLLPSDEGDKIAERRISYLVEYEEDANTKGRINFTIKSLIEYRKKIKGVFSIETKNNVLYHQQSMKLKDLLMN